MPTSRAPRRLASAPLALVLALTLTLLAPDGVPVVAAAEEGEDIAAAAVDGPSFTSRPRWEIGVGGGVFSGHDYPASDDPNRRALALPFFVYRSPVFRLGEGGVRAVAIERPRVRLDLSIGGSLNASSESDGTRAGMPELDFLFELGPQLELSLLDRPTARSSGGRVQLDLVAELRAVVSTDFRGLRSRGFVAEAGLDAALRRVGGSRVDLLAGLDVTFADERLHDYFYEVEPRFATPSRPAYAAGGGYLGSELFLGAAIRPGRDLRVFLGVQGGLYGGAANEGSPLFETESNVGVALGFVWTLARSRRLVDVVERD